MRGSLDQQGGGRESPPPMIKARLPPVPPICSGLQQGSRLRRYARGPLARGAPGGHLQVRP